VDDDCDGSFDEHWVAGTCGVGACVATETCVSGVESCTPGTPTIDNDCDNVDDDCDGGTDEHWIPGTCGVGGCLAFETCVSGVESCTPGTPTSDANCNGVDNDCDGSTDEHYVPYTCGTCPDLSECISGSASCTPDTWCNDDGHATLIGHDYYASNTNVDRIVGNAVFLTTATGTVQVLGYTQYADTSSTGEVAHTNAAVDARASALGRTWRLQTFTDYTQLDTLLPGYHVLIVYEQESASATLMQTVGTAWTSTLNTFVNSGGVVVVADYSGSSWEILDTSGLMTITASAGVSIGASLTIAAPGDAVATGVSNPYLATNGSRSYTTSDTVVVSQTSTAAPVVIHKLFTAGGGCDTYSEDFVNGSSSPAQCTSWNSWRAGLATSGYTRVTMKGTYDTTGITCSVPATAQAIADAIRTGGRGTWTCDGHNWSLCDRYSGELWIDPPLECSGANCPNPGYLVRPCIGNLNWGGVNTATCTTNPSQNMTVEFCGSGGSSWSGIRTFTNCTATGPSGPTQAQCDTEYSGTTLDGEVTLTSGIQTWTVPITGTYRIVAYGAEGMSADPSYSGGDGAMVGGNFVLTAGEVLSIMVGQMATEDGCSGGGGGGTFVVNSGGSAMIVAGGGAGTRTSVVQNGCDGRTSQEAGTGSGSLSSHGCGAKSGSITLGGIVSASSWGSGGAGFVGNGAADGSWGTASMSYAAGGVGGTGTAAGGFGGGGTGNGACGGGGGGGYSGGDGGRVAGGGGSYNSGSSPSATAGANTGHGYATIDLL